MRHYATLFDAKYLPQGLVLYESLKQHSSEEFRLHVLALDDETHKILDNLMPPDMVVTGLDWFEMTSPYAMENIRRSRSWAEYCWTLASQWSEFFSHSEITYLDADLMFFSDPKVIHDEIGDRSIAVIPHRLIPSKRHLEVNGKFNVSWVTFKNNPVGRECLSTWAAQCREKCSATDGCGDQKYVEEFEKYGTELCVIDNIGAGAAPWNIANWKVTEGPCLDGQPIVFFHAHEFRIKPDGEFYLTGYELRDEDRRFIYEPYVSMVKSALARIRNIHERSVCEA